MSGHRPPRLAMLLLGRFAVGPLHESLVGDLVEQFHGGRSRLWFWRQAIAAITASVVHTLRRHPWLTLRALTVGWAVFFVAGLIANRLVMSTRSPLIQGLSENGIYGEDVAFWTFHGPSIFLTYTAYAMSGWLVARLHRRAATAFLLFAASIFLFEYGFATFMLATSGREFPYGGWILLAALIGRPVALLMGGFVALGTTADLKVRATYW